jgi:hypothetical protein
MGAIFPVFLVSQLKKCLCIPEERVAVRRIKLGYDLSYEEKPIQVLDTQERVTRNRVVNFTRWFGVIIVNVTLHGRGKII